MTRRVVAGRSLVTPATWRAVRVDAIAPAAWRNGGGTTREIARWAGARLSLADIDRAGPFSVFAGLRRWIAVLHGRVGLRFAGSTIGLDAGSDPFAFDGADAPHADPGPVGGCRVLNLMLAPERAPGGGLRRVELRAGDVLDAGGACAAYVCRGTLIAGEARVAAGDALVGDARVAAGDTLVGDDTVAAGGAHAGDDTVAAGGAHAGDADVEWRAGEDAVVLVARLGDGPVRPRAEVRA